MKKLGKVGLGLPRMMNGKSEVVEEDHICYAFVVAHPGVSLPVAVPAPPLAPLSTAEVLELLFVSQEIGLK